MNLEPLRAAVGVATMLAVFAATVKAAVWVAGGALPEVSWRGAFALAAAWIVIRALDVATFGRANAVEEAPRLRPIPPDRLRGLR